MDRANNGQGGNSSGKETTTIDLTHTSQKDAGNKALETKVIRIDEKR
jgi:hypothetical protein